MSPGLFLLKTLNKIFHPKVREYRNSPNLYIRKQIEWAKVSLSFFNDEINIKDKIVLDAGCSLGGKTIYYQSLKPGKIFGLDIDAARLDFARSFAEKSKTDIEFKLGSISDMPFGSDYFDLIFLNDVVEHIDLSLLDKAIKECKRVIKPSGKICLEFPPWESYDASHLYDYTIIPWCHLIFSDETLKKLVETKDKIPTFGQSQSWEHYKQLNRITTRHFEKVICDNGLNISRFRRRMIKNIALLNYIPYLRKYFTARAIYILTK